MAEDLPAVVAIPVRNEAERVTACLLSLAGQVGTGRGRFGVVLFINNTTDATRQVVDALGPLLPFPVRVLEDETARPPNAGWARRTAMEAAAAWLDEGEGPRLARAVILTTDADTVVPPDWIARNLAAIDLGACAVAGAISLDPAEAERLPAGLRARGALEGRYESLLIELTSRLAAVPHDPWPRHWTTSGASLAVTLDAYRAVGGMPEHPVGEDRAFVAALVASGARVRHDPAIRVVTSGRLVGRAVGGAADTMRLRAEHPDVPCDDRLESVARATARILSPRLGLAAVPLRPRQLPLQILLARSLLLLLRLRDRLRPPAGRRAGTARSGMTDPGRAGPHLSPSARQ